MVVHIQNEILAHNSQTDKGNVTFGFHNFSATAGDDLISRSHPIPAERSVQHGERVCNDFCTRSRVKVEPESLPEEQSGWRGVASVDHLDAVQRVLTRSRAIS